MEATKSQEVRQAIATRVAQMKASKLATLSMLKRFHNGVGPNRDADLVKACQRINRKICEQNQTWLPKFLFRPVDGPMFHVEGTSTAILYNYIPDTDANVYAVYERNVVANYTGMIERLANWHAVDIPTDCEYICTDTIIFNTDIVSTHDTFLAEVFAQRIAFYAQYKR